MTLLLDRPVAAGLTLSPQAQAPPPGLQAAEDFYLRGSDRQFDRTIEIRVRARDGNLRRTWLAAHMEDRLNALLRLRLGWDGYRAQPLSMDAVEAAVDVLFGMADDLSLPPQLFPLPDGGIQMEWHADGEDLEIEVDPAGSAHVLATDASGLVVVDAELAPSRPQTQHAARKALHRLSERLAGAR
jgi:hypothetical protein